MWQEFNNNPVSRKVGDCAVRAVSAALDIPWETAYALMAVNGLSMGDLPSSNSVWGSVLRQRGFSRDPREMADQLRDLMDDAPQRKRAA